MYDTLVLARWLALNVGKGQSRLLTLIGVGRVQSHPSQETDAHRLETFEMDVTKAVGIDQKMMTAHVTA